LQLFFCWAKFFYLPDDGAVPGRLWIEADGGQDLIGMYLREERSAMFFIVNRNQKRKREPIKPIPVESLVAGRGFEPLTFGL